MKNAYPRLSQEAKTSWRSTYMDFSKKSLKDALATMKDYIEMEGDAESVREVQEALKKCLDIVTALGKKEDKAIRESYEKRAREEAEQEAMG